MDGLSRWTLVRKLVMITPHTQVMQFKWVGSGKFSIMGLNNIAHSSEHRLCVIKRLLVNPSGKKRVIMPGSGAHRSMPPCTWTKSCSDAGNNFHIFWIQSWRCEIICKSQQSVGAQILCSRIRSVEWKGGILLYLVIRVHRLRKHIIKVFEMLAFSTEA